MPEWCGVYFLGTWLAEVVHLRAPSPARGRFPDSAICRQALYAHPSVTAHRLVMAPSPCRVDQAVHFRSFRWTSAVRLALSRDFCPRPRQRWVAGPGGRKRSWRRTIVCATLHTAWRPVAGVYFRTIRVSLGVRSFCLHGSFCRAWSKRLEELLVEILGNDNGQGQFLLFCVDHASGRLTQNLSSSSPGCWTAVQGAEPSVHRPTVADHPCR